MARFHNDLTAAELQIGSTVKLLSFGNWYDATVIELTERRAHVTYTNKSGNTYDFWLTIPGKGKPPRTESQKEIARLKSLRTRIQKWIDEFDGASNEFLASRGYGDTRREDLKRYVDREKSRVAELTSEIDALVAKEA